MGGFKQMVAAVDQQGFYKSLETEKLFDTMDSNGSGQISKEEFYRVALRDEYQHYLRTRYSQFAPEYTEINKQLAINRKHNLQDFFMIQESTLSNMEFRRSATLLGLKPDSERYYMMLKAFEDPDRPGNLHLGKVRLE